MAVLQLSPDAKADLEVIRARDVNEFARVLAVLQEIETDQQLKDHLLDHNFGRDKTSAPIFVTKWQKQWHTGKDLWRLRVWKLEDQGTNLRFVYAYIPGTGQFLVLGILQKSEFDYDDTTNALRSRVLDAYDNL